MSPPGRRDVAERIERCLHVHNTLCTPAQVGKFFDGERITGIVADRTALLNSSTDVLGWDRDLRGVGKRDYSGILRCGFFQRGSRKPPCLVRFGQVFIPGLFHEGATGWQHKPVIAALQE